MIITPIDDAAGYKVVFIGDLKAWAAANGNWTPAPGQRYVDVTCDFHYWKQGKATEVVRAEFENDGGEMAMYLEANAGKPAWYGYQQGADHLWSHGYDPAQANMWKLFKGWGVNPNGNAQLNVRDAADWKDIHPWQGSMGAFAFYWNNVCTGRIYSPAYGNIDIMTSGAPGMTRAVRFTASDTRNMLLGPAANTSGDGMQNGIAISEGVPPQSPSVATGKLFVHDGALYYMGDHGTVTKLADR